MEKLTKMLDKSFYEKYDEPHEFASLAGKCVFCGIIKKNDPNKILYQVPFIL